MDAKHEVLDAARRRADALGAGDAESLLGLLHEDFIWTTHRGDTFDRAAYVERNTQGQTVWRSQRLDHPVVTVVGNTAVLHAEVMDIVDDRDGQPESFRMPMTQVWVRTDEGWTCLAGHAGPRRDG
jgi:ketosteroid isomerase-like protein